MYGLTFVDEFGKTQLICFDGRAAIFNSKELATKFETDVFVPHAMKLIENGVESKRFLWFKKYTPISMEEKRRITRILQTILIQKIENIKYGKVR